MEKKGKISSSAILILFALLLYPYCSNAPATEEERYQKMTQDLQEMLDEGIAKVGGKGISAAVLIPEHELWTGTAGRSHGTTLITADMVFSAGSITKMFTAATILQLAEEGVLNLEDTLSQWLPDFEHIDRNITLRQLLNHTCGIYNITEHLEIWDEIIWNSEKHWEIEEIIRAYLKEPYFEPGNGWHYSNTGYLLLRMLIRSATGSSIAEQYQSRFFNPLSLTGCSLVIDEWMPANTAHGWYDTDGNGVYDDLSLIPMTAFYSGAGGGVFCRAADLVLWAKALLSERTVLSQATMTEMMDFHTPCPGQSFLAGYGLGVILFEPSQFNGLTIWGHSGSAPGYAAACFFLPDYDVCIGFMDNTHEGDSMPVLFALIEIIVEYMDQ